MKMKIEKLEKEKEKPKQIHKLENLGKKRCELWKVKSCRFLFLHWFFTSDTLITSNVMALPNVIWPWSIFYSKDQLLKKENEESLWIFYFPKIEYSKLINYLGGMCQTCQGTTIYGLFRI